jgi:DNA-3-methyladenine glycosylase II
LACGIDLPERFRADDCLAFHGRDPSRLAERVDGGMLRKGMMWDGHAACLAIAFEGRRARAELSVDHGVLRDDAPDALKSMARRMLGLTQPVEDFERIHGTHPQLGPLIARNRGLRVAVAATPFEALSWAITGQQISVAAATAIRRRLIQAAGIRHSGGLCCYPDAERVAGMAEVDLRQAGFSEAKARTLLTLCRLVRDRSVPLEAWAKTVPVEDIRGQLQRIRGIGPWTIDYALLRGFGWLDGSLHGDAAVRRSLQRLLGSTEKITEIQAKQWLAGFSPWRALVAAHLWAMRPKDVY